MSNAQAIAYLAAAVTTGGSAPTVAPMYENRKAIEDGLGSQAVLMDFSSPGNSDRPIRALLSCGTVSYTHLLSRASTRSSRGRLVSLKTT